MAKGKPNLAAALAKRDESTKEQPVKEIQGQETPPPAKKLRSDRSDQVNVSAWFPKTVKFTLDELRIKRQRELGRRVTIQELMGEAYNDLFKKYGFPEVAPTRDE